MTTSFRDGLAFCALIHKNRPDLIKFDALKKGDVYDNNKLAFRIAEEELGIPALLDAEDMVALKVPDRLSILTYVSQYYNYFHGRSPIGGMGGIKRPAEAPTEAPSGKKNQPVVAKVFPSSKPAAENLAPPASSLIPASRSVKLSPTPARPAAQDEVLVERSNQTGTLSNMCAVCQTRVHLVQRQLVGGKLYHRNCAKSLASVHSTALRDLSSNTPVSKYVPHSERPQTTPDPPKPAASATPAASQPGPSWLTSKVDKFKPSATSATNLPAASPRSITAAGAKTDPQDLPSKTPVSKYVPHAECPKQTVDPAKPAASTTPAGSQLGPSWLTSKADKSKSSSTSSSNLPGSSAKSVTSIHSNAGHQDLPSKTPASKYVPYSDRPKQSLDPPKPAVSQPGPSWLTKADKFKPSATSTTNPPAASPRSVTAANSKTASQDLPSKTPVSKYVPHSDKAKATVDPAKPNVDPLKLAGSSTPASSQLGFSWLTSKADKPKPSATSSNDPPAFSPLPATTQISSLGTGGGKSPGSTTTTITTTTSPQPTPAPRTSISTAKTQEARLKFFQSGPETTSTVEAEDQKVPPNKGPNMEAQGLGIGKSTVNVAEVKEKFGSKDVSVTMATGGTGAKVSDPVKVASKEECGNSNGSSKTHTSAIVISKKGTEVTNNNNESLAPWITVELKKTDKPVSVIPPKNGSEGTRGRVKLKADMSLLDDLETTPSPPKASKGGFWSKTQDKGSSKPTAASSTPSVPEANSNPLDWRSMLKPVAKETKSVLPSPDSKQTDFASNPRNSQDFQPATASSSTPQPSPSQPSTWGLLNGTSSSTANKSKMEIAPSKTKQDYIPKEDILRELQEIEDNLNELEMRGVELERQLRSEEEDDSVMDELMTDWFSLIRNKQLAMRRESELVYIAKTQDLEEQQPSVEQELRKLMDTPERLKTSWDKRREKELMDKLVEIVNDRNAIVDGLDEDRLREVEEDEELNKLMKNLELKKDKPKKKKFFNWGGKKED